MPVGVGVNTGVAFVGAVGSSEGVVDITALGDAVNTTARLASMARTGEILLSDATMQAANIDPKGLEQRNLELKGKSETFSVKVMKITPQIE